MLTRGGGSCGRFLSAAKSLGALGEDHTREVEPIFRDNFIQNALELDGAILENSFLRSGNNFFFTKLIIYKDADQQVLDKKTQIFPFGTATTWRGSIKPLRSELNKGFRVVSFLGENLTIDPNSEVHAWGMLLTKGEDGYQMDVKESVFYETGGKIPHLAKMIAQELKIDHVKLWDPTGHEYAEQEECYELAFWFIGDILDGCAIDTKFKSVVKFDVKKKMYVKS